LRACASHAAATWRGCSMCSMCSSRPGPCPLAKPTCCFRICMAADAAITSTLPVHYLLTTLLSCVAELQSLAAIRCDDHGQCCLCCVIGTHRHAHSSGTHFLGTIPQQACPWPEVTATCDDPPHPHSGLQPAGWHQGVLTSCNWRYYHATSPALYFAASSVL
jgi:hypothetical protein